MSSPAKRPYKSRVFNFLNRQSRRLQEQYKQTVRHVKVAAVWGVQIVLYPVYLLAQTARLAGHQLQQTAQQTLLQLQAKKPSQQKTPPPADKPIQRVLSLVDTEVPLWERGRGGDALIVSPFLHPLSSQPYPFPEVAGAVQKTQTLPNGVVTHSETQLAEATENELSSARLAIGGVACLLTTRRLVLVTVDNQILDILTPEQRQKLHQRIIWELADYWRFWRRVEASRQQFSGRVQSLPPEESPLLPPVRFFWQVMAWVQTSPVAITVNLFGESTLVRSHQTSVRRNKSRMGRKTSTDKRHNFIIIPSLAGMVLKVAEMEAHPLQPVSQLTITITHRTQGVLQRLQAKIRQPLAPATPPQSPATGDASEQNWLRIDALIRAAIDYFFGRGGGKFPGNSDSAARAGIGGRANYRQRRQSAELPPDMDNPPQLAAGEEEDPWLTWKDLFDDLAAPIRGKRQQAPSHSNSISEVDTAPSQSPAQLPEGERVTQSLPAKEEVPSERSIFRVIKRNLPPSQPNLARRQATASNKLAETQPSSNTVTQFPTNSTTANAPIPVSNVQANVEQVTLDNAKPVATAASDRVPPEHQPDWIETQATPTGYVKHPLERLLGWLDRGMVWFEELFAKIWRWVKRLF